MSARAVASILLATAQELGALLPTLLEDRKVLVDALQGSCHIGLAALQIRPIFKFSSTVIFGKSDGLQAHGQYPYE
jgi:hypothetical protein